MFKSWRAAALTAVALGGCLALTACGTVQLGAAAIVGNQRITTATLATQVSDLTGYYDAHKAKVTLAFPASQIPRQVLAWLIRFQVRDELASREHITVTAGDIQRAIDTITTEERQSGDTASLTAIAVANGLPPDLVNSGLGRYEAIETVLITRLGGPRATTIAAQEKLSGEFNRDQCLAAKSLHIKVSPQFGALDYSQLDIVPAPDTLSAPESGPSSTSATQLRPPC